MNLTAENSELHTVYRNDPRKLQTLLRRHVCVRTKNNKSFSGWVQTVDPVSESFILLNIDATGSSVESVVVVFGYNILDVTLHDDETTPSMASVIDSFLKKNVIHYTKSEITERKVALCVWLKNNRVPFILKDDNVLEVLQYASICPPYCPQNITCTNEVVLDKLLKLLLDCPNLNS